MGRMSGEGWGRGARRGRSRGRGKARGRKDSKHRGDVAEMRFMLEAAEHGFGVAKPFGDDERYDCIVDTNERLWRVQVKLSGARHHRGFSVRACWRNSHRHMPYTAADVDFLAVFVVKGRIWYVIPVRALAGRLTIHLYPYGNRKGGKGQRMEKYREAWHLLGR